MFELKDVELDKTEQAEFHPTTEGILKDIESAVGLDIAPNHTGIAIWKYGKLIRRGFKLSEYDKDDLHAEYHMREELKKHLWALLGDSHFEYIIIEDVYGGQNFDTVRKLIALNTVIDELICEGSIRVDHFIRWKESEWAKYFRHLLKLSGRPQAKYETQEILCYIQDEFYMQNKDLSEAEKRKIFFEDICDASGMVYAVGMWKAQGEQKDTDCVISLKDIKMVYVNHLDDYVTVRDPIISSERPELQAVEVPSDIEALVLSLCKTHTDKVLAINLPARKLGIWGLKKKYTYFEDGDGCLIFYVKRKGSCL